jgi:hypothetical protein
LRMLFSKITSDISNEMDETKLRLWPTITDSIIRNKELTFDKKQVFISIFNRLDGFSLKYLATLYNIGKIDYKEIFNMDGSESEMGTLKHSYNLAQLQCLPCGLVGLKSGAETYMYLTSFGKEFIDFVSNKSQEYIDNI